MRVRSLTFALMLLLSAALVSSCYRHQVVFQEGPATPVASVADVHQFFVIGLIDIGGPIPIDAICPQGTSEIYLRAGLVNVIVAFFTGNFITARSSYFACGGGGYYH